MKPRWGRLLALTLCAVVPAAMALAADTQFTPRRDGIEASSGALRLRVTALNDSILRVQIAPQGQWPEDASWVVSSARRQQSVTVEAESRGRGFRTETLRVRLSRAMGLRIEDLDGHVISADSIHDPVQTTPNGFILRKALGNAEHAFALGDKTGPLDRRGRRFVDWNTDPYNFTSATDPLYKSVPFLLLAGGTGGSYGVLLDNTWRSWFDVARRDRHTLEIGADGGPIDYYLIHGPTPKQVVERYTELSGRPPLPPLWALGYQQSRYSYMSADDVRQVAARLRADQIPADVLWLDIDFQDRNRPFTTNPITFADFPGLIRDLRAQDFRVVAITDLHVAAAPGQHYAPYDSGMATNEFVHTHDGAVFVGEVWPGATVFPDFTRQVTRQWWGQLYRDFVSDGVAGFWNDMNEPALFHTASKTMPLDVVHRIDEPGFAVREASHAEIHNIYGMENSRATFEGLQQLTPDERPFVMTRASFAGGQRYAVTWTGDDTASWEHLKLSIAMLLNLGLSGFAYSGADVGGFIGDPSPALLTRWIEVGAFTPIMRNHSGKGTRRREPWLDGPQQEAIRRRFISERYRLLPYLYALADEAGRTGLPLMRPVMLEFPETLGAHCSPDNLFMLGEALLIAPPPVLESEAPYEICLPPGSWYDYWSGVALGTRGGTPGERLHHRLRLQAPLDSLPVLVRAGSILPRQAVTASTATTPDTLQIEVYPGPHCHGTLYADDGHTLAYQRGHYLRQQLECSVEKRALSIDFAARQGDYTPAWQHLAVRVHGWAGPAQARYDGTELSPQVEPASQSVLVMLSAAAGSHHLRLSHVAAE